MARVAEYSLLSTRCAGTLQMAKNAGVFANEDVGAAVKATATLTASGAFSDTETITIGSKTYTMKTTLTPAANEVLIGANAAASLDNLKSAVNASAGAGTTYGTGTTANAQFEATTNTDTTQLFVALVYGTAGNAYATTETCANAAFGGATASGGANQTVATVQADIRANTVPDEFTVLREKAAEVLGIGANIGDVSTTTMTADDTAAEVISRFNEVSGKVDIL